MQRTSLKVLTGLAAVTAILAGCGQASTPTSSLAAVSQAGAAAGHRHPGGWGPEAGKGGEHGRPGPGGMFGLDLKDLALSADQQAQLKALVEKHKPAAPPSPGAAGPGKALRDAVLATTVDDAALRAALKAEADERASHTPPSPAEMLTAVRAILTDDQRSKLIAKLEAAPAPGDRPSPHPRPSGETDPRTQLLASLNLTADQKAAYDALEAAQKANFEARKPGDHKAAMLAFWQTGDTSGLTPPARPEFPTEAFVKVVESLDLAQRTALFGKGGIGFEGGWGRQGGHGGFGGHKGKGGPEGARDHKGGHGGFGPRAARPDGDASGAAAPKN